jgi:hypothetical protein
MKVAVSDVKLSKLHRYSAEAKHGELPSHKMMALLPDGTYEFLSDMIRDEFGRRIAGLKDDELRKLYLGLLEARDFKGPAAGDALEAYFHRMAQRDKGFIKKVVEKATSLHDAVDIVHPPKVTSPLNIIIFQRRGKESLTSGGTYYQPFDTNFPVVDSFVVVESDVVAFQVTNVEDHRPTVNAVIDFFTAMKELGLDFESRYHLHLIWCCRWKGQIKKLQGVKEYDVTRLREKTAEEVIEAHRNWQKVHQYSVSISELLEEMEAGDKRKE